jgi:hypothetical protein
MFLASPSRESRNSEMAWDQQSRSTLDLTVIGNCKWDPTIRNVASPPAVLSLFLLLPSLLCSAYSDLAIDDLPTILCTISSELIRIFSAASSHNAHLLHTFCTHAIFTVVLAINDKYTSMRCLLNICQHQIQ